MDTELMVDDIVKRCTAVRVLSTARSIARRYDEALRPVDLTITQFTLLASIARHTPHSISDLADKLYLERTSLTRNAKVLEKDGFLKRTDTGGRGKTLTITRKGADRLKKAYPLWQKVQSETEEKIGADLDELITLLKLARG